MTPPFLSPGLIGLMHWQIIILWAAKGILFFLRVNKVSWVNKLQERSHLFYSLSTNLDVEVNKFMERLLTMFLSMLITFVFLTLICKPAFLSCFNVLLVDCCNPSSLSSRIPKSSPYLTSVTCFSGQHELNRCFNVKPCDAVYGGAWAALWPVPGATLNHSISISPTRRVLKVLVWKSRRTLMYLADKWWYFNVC